MHETQQDVPYRMEEHGWGRIYETHDRAARIDLFGGSALVTDMNWAGTGMGVGVTKRDFAEYTARYGRHPIGPHHLAPGMRVCEWGSGLGGFLEACIARGTEKPIAVDPANFAAIYALARGILDSGNYPAQNETALALVSDRCALLLSDNVTLLNMRVSDAIETHPELRGTIDILVDNQGPVAYAERERPGYDTKELLAAKARTLLSPRGRYFCI